MFPTRNRVLGRPYNTIITSSGERAPIRQLRILAATLHVHLTEDVSRVDS